MLANLINERGHEPGFRIIKYLNLRTKINIAHDYCLGINHRSTKKQEHIKTIFKKLQEISEFRNKVAHANWQTLQKDGFVRVNIKEDQSGAGVYFELVKMTPGTIRKFIRQSESLTKKIHELSEGLN